MKRGGTPATTIMAATTSTMMIAVPRSGWSTIRTRGTAPMVRMRRTSRMVRPWGRRWQYVATASTMISTANSLGWTWMKPKLYHRWAPSALWPTRKTPSRLSSEST